MKHISISFVITADVTKQENDAALRLMAAGIRDNRKTAKRLLKTSILIKRLIERGVIKVGDYNKEDVYS